MGKLPIILTVAYIYEHSENTKRSGQRTGVIHKLLHTQRTEIETFHFLLIGGYPSFPDQDQVGSETTRNVSRTRLPKVQTTRLYHCGPSFTQKTEVSGPGQQRI